MSEIFYHQKDINLIDNLVIDVKKLYREVPIAQKINAKPNQVDFIRTTYHKIYRNSLIPKKFRKFLWQSFRQLNIDLSWFNEFKKHWSRILGARPLWAIKSIK